MNTERTIFMNLYLDTRRKWLKSQEALKVPNKLHELLNSEATKMDYFAYADGEDFKQVKAMFRDAEMYESGRTAVYYSIMCDIAYEMNTNFGIYISKSMTDDEIKTAFQQGDK